MKTVRVFVGTDRSQLFGARVLEYSIKRHSSLPVEVTPMLNVRIRPPKDPAQDQRTGFSFARFCIPQLAGYQGRAIYMDADMLVMKDIAELWTLPFESAKVLIQEELQDHQAETHNKKCAPVKRIKQCSVMLLDCENLAWNIEEIIDGLDEKRYTYDDLMYQLCILKEQEVHARIPFRWNSLEHLDESTCLIHYTDMRTQPWVYPLNPNGERWVDEVRRMLSEGVINWDDIRREVELGYVRPSLLTELKHPRPRGTFGKALHALDFANDRIKGYQGHLVGLKETHAYLKKMREEFATAL